MKIIWDGMGLRQVVDSYADSMIAQGKAQEYNKKNIDAGLMTLEQLQTRANEIASGAAPAPAIEKTKAAKAKPVIVPDSDPEPSADEPEDEAVEKKSTRK